MVSSHAPLRRRSDIHNPDGDHRYHALIVSSATYPTRHSEDNGAASATGYLVGDVLDHGVTSVLDEW